MKTSKLFYLLMASVFVITTVFFSSCSKDDEETPKKPDTAVDTPVTPPAPSGDTDEPEPSTPAEAVIGSGVKERIEIYLEGNMEKWSIGGDITGFSGDDNYYVSGDEYVHNQSSECIRVNYGGLGFDEGINYPLIVSLKNKGTLFLSFGMIVGYDSDREVAGDITLTVKGYTGDVETNSYTRTFKPTETLSLMFYANKIYGKNKPTILDNSMD